MPGTSPLDAKSSTLPYALPSLLGDGAAQRGRAMAAAKGRGRASVPAGVRLQICVAAMRRNWPVEG
jgi:hypothetical protein